MEKDNYKEIFWQQISDKFIHLLELEQTSWIKGWDAPAVNSPINAVTGHRYNGINSFTLALTALACGFTDPRWATMHQIQDAKNTYHKDQKWYLKAGSHGTKVEYWYPYDRVTKHALTWLQYTQELNNGRSEKEFFVMSRYYTVFNASQIEGIAPFVQEHDHGKIQADKLIADLSKSMNVPIIFDGGNSAYYRPSTDDIHLPAIDLFHSSAEFNGTALHELGHSTGHPDRLDRVIQNKFGSEQYAFEELIAEMTACFMAAYLSDIDLCAFNRFENNIAYLQAWIRAIREKPETLIRAVKEAERATRYMENQIGIILDHDYKFQNLVEQSKLIYTPLQPVMEQSPQSFQNRFQQSIQQKQNASTEQKHKVQKASSIRFHR